MNRQTANMLNGIPPHMDIRRSACPPECPGCAHRHLSASESLTQKQRWIVKKLIKWGDTIQPIQTPGPGLRQGYRENVCLSSSWENSQWSIGLRHRDAVIPIPDCPVHSSRVRSAMASFAHALPPASEFPMIYYAQSGGQVTLILKSKEMPPMSWLSPDLREKLGLTGIDGVWLHRHPSAGRRVFAKNRWDLVWGKARSVDQQGFVYGPTSFQQLIPGLYNQALDAAEFFLSPGEDDLLFDLYAGIGASLARWPRQAKHVIGVELSGESFECAKLNAPSAVIYRGACHHRLAQLTEALEYPHQKRLLYANPPRTGLEAEIRQWIAKVCQPGKLAYLSCSAGTLKRDLTELENQGYRIEQIIPYDFFPHTLHVEALALLQRVPDA